MSSDRSPMRLQKYISRAGVASRRQAETWMAQGRVRVNGEVAVTPGMQVTPGQDRVEVDGREIHLSDFHWIALNKPLGTVTTRKDPRGRPTVYTLLPPEHRSLRYVGRLDLLTQGLLLFTNEGDVMHRLLHPSSEVSREYRASVQGVPGEATLRSLEAGVELDDGPARAESVRVFKGGSPRRNEAVVTLLLREGRKHEVRRLLEAVGHPVVSLERTAFGPLRLGDLPRGEWRELSAAEISALRVAAGMQPGPSSGSRGGSGRGGSGRGGSGRGSGRKVRPEEKPSRPRPRGGRSGTR